MKRKTFLIAAVTAEVKAKLIVARFEKEFLNGNQNQRGNGTKAGQTNNAQGNVPQQPVYRG